MGTTESFPAVACAALVALLSSAHDAAAQNLEDYFARVCVPGVGCFEGTLPAVDLDRQFQSPFQVGGLSGQAEVSGIASGFGPLARVVGEVTTTADQDYTAAHDAGTGQASARVVYSVQLTKNANFTLKTGFAQLPLAARVETSTSGDGRAIATALISTSLRSSPSFSAPFLTIFSQACQNLAPGTSCNPGSPGTESFIGWGVPGGTAVITISVSGSATNANRTGPGSAFASFQAVADPIISLPDGYVPEEDIVWLEGETPHPVLWSEAFTVAVTPGVTQSLPEPSDPLASALAIAAVFAARAATRNTVRRR